MFNLFRKLMTLKMIIFRHKYKSAQLKSQQDKFNNNVPFRVSSQFQHKKKNENEFKFYFEKSK